MTDAELTEFLTKEMGFSGEAAADMVPKFTADQKKKIEQTRTDAVTFRSTQAEIEKTRKQLAAENERLNEEMAEWARLSAKEKAEATELRASMEQARVRAVQLETRLTNLATEHGVDPKSLLEGTAAIPAKKEEPVAPAIDPNTLVTRQMYGETMGFALDLPAQLQYIADEHRELTGQRLDTREIVNEVKARAGKKDAVIDPVKIWEEKYGIPAKREAKAAELRKQEDAAAEARGYERARTEMATPGASAPGRHAIVFGNRGADGTTAPRTSVLKRPQPETGLRSAAAALATHKYRPKTA